MIRFAAFTKILLGHQMKKAQPPCSIFLQLARAKVVSNARGSHARPPKTDVQFWIAASPEYIPEARRRTPRGCSCLGNQAEIESRVEGPTSETQSSPNLGDDTVAE